MNAGDIRLIPRNLPETLHLPDHSKIPTLRILFVAPGWFGCTSLQRAQALADLGHHITYVDYGGLGRPAPLVERIVRSLFRRTGYPLEWEGENRNIKRAILNGKFDVLWIEKGLTIKPGALRFARARASGIVIVAYSPDDMGTPDNQSMRWLKSVPLYDLHVTTKSYNVPELKSMGARNVLFIDKSYDPHTHRPMNLTRDELEHYGADVSFVGDYESERAASMLQLAEAGVSVRVWGTRWHKLGPRIPQNMRVELRPVYGDEYAKVLNAGKINLCYLRKAGRDLQTARTMEIPACGGFMLGERTPEHLRLFEEGREAEYFAGQEELLSKIGLYLQNPARRKAVAEAGYSRCVTSGYSNHHRMLAILDAILNV